MAQDAGPVKQDEEGPTVLVVGAGPVGLAFAIECLRFGVHVQVVDKATAKEPYSKAFGLHARTLEHFMGMGVLPAILQEASATTKVTVRSSIARASYGWGSIQSRFKAIYMLSQRRLEDILEAQLHLFGGKVERGVEFLEAVQPNPENDDHGPASPNQEESQPKGVRVRLRDTATGRERWLACKYLVGADGAHSAVRKALGVPFEGAAYPEEFYLLDGRIRLRPGSPPFTSTIFVGSPALACFHLDRDVVRIISSAPPATTNSQDNGNGAEAPPAAAESPDDEDNDPSLGYKAGVPAAALDREAARCLLGMLKERCPEAEGLFDVEWSARFRIHRRLAERYRVGCAFLMGDAAHIHSPVGGQGLNTGVQDAVNLAWKLALVERFGADPGVLLASYGAERRPAGEATLSVTDSLTNTVFMGGLIQRAARFILFPVVPLIVSREFIAKRLVHWMSQMSVNVRGSGIVRGEGAFPAEAPQPGDRMPDGPLVRMTSGGSTGLLEATCRGLRHTLLLFGGGEGRRVLDLQHLGGGDGDGDGDAARLRRFADVVAVVHVSRHYYLPSSSSSSAAAAPTPATAKENGSSSKGSAVPMEALYDAGAVAQAFGLVDPKQPLEQAGVMECLFLVRPDGYVAVRAAGWGLLPVVEYLGTLFPERVAAKK